MQSVTCPLKPVQHVVRTAITFGYKSGGLGCIRRCMVGRGRPTSIRRLCLDLRPGGKEAPGRAALLWRPEKASGYQCVIGKPPIHNIYTHMFNILSNLQAQHRTHFASHFASVCCRMRFPSSVRPYSQALCANLFDRTKL